MAEINNKYHLLPALPTFLLNHCKQLVTSPIQQASALWVSALTVPGAGRKQ